MAFFFGFLFTANYYYAIVILALGALALLSFSKKNYFLVLLPFIISSSFFGFLPRPFAIRGLFQQDDIALLCLLLGAIFLYVFSQQQDDRSGIVFPATPFIQKNKFLVMFFLAFLIFVLFFSWIKYGQIIQSFKVFRGIFRYLSILPFMYILFRIRHKNIEKLINCIEVITIILSVCYILDFGFGIKIFNIQSHIETSFYGVDITRNFLARPYFLYFVLLRLILRGKYKKYHIIGIFSIVLVFFLSYTRNRIFSLILFSTVAMIICNRKYTKNILSLVKTSVMTSVSILILGGVIYTVFNTQLGYLSRRFDKGFSASSISEDSNLLLRKNIILSRAKKVLAVNPITGLGYLHPETGGGFYPGLFVRKSDDYGSALVGDQSWGNLIVMIGFGGSFLFLLMLFFPIIMLIRKKCFLKQNITLIAVFLALLDMVLLNAFFSNVFLKEVLKISFYYALIIYYANSYLLGSNNRSNTYLLIRNEE